MFDIENKQGLIDDISREIDNFYPAKTNVSHYFNSYQGGSYIQVGGERIDLGLLNNLQSEIVKAINEVAYNVANEIAKEITKEAIKQIISRLYTHDEFERDLGIRT